MIVRAFWGQAIWGRTQLLGEIARGGWGMYSEEPLFSEPRFSTPDLWRLPGRLPFALHALVLENQVAVIVPVY